MGDVAHLGVLSLVVSNEGVQILFVFLNRDVALLVHSVEVTDEGHIDLTLSRMVAINRRLILENYPVVLRISRDVDLIIEDVRFLRRRDIIVEEQPRVASITFVDLGLRQDLQTVILTLSFVAGEDEAEFEVLLVGQLFGAEDESAVELPDALIHLAVLLEELQLHRIALSIVERARRDQVVYLHISGRIIELYRLVNGAALHEGGQGKLGELSKHLQISFFINKPKKAVHYLSIKFLTVS